MIICACKEAKKNCEVNCEKGLKLKPERIYYAPWNRRATPISSNK